MASRSLLVLPIFLLTVATIVNGRQIQLQLDISEYDHASTKPEKKALTNATVPTISFKTSQFSIVTRVIEDEKAKEAHEKAGHDTKTEFFHLTLKDVIKETEQPYIEMIVTNAAQQHHLDCRFSIKLTDIVGEKVTVKMDVFTDVIQAHGPEGNLLYKLHRMAVYVYGFKHDLDKDKTGHMTKLRQKEHMDSKITIKVEHEKFYIVKSYRIDGDAKLISQGVVKKNTKRYFYELEMSELNSNEKVSIAFVGQVLESDAAKILRVKFEIPSTDWKDNKEVVVHINAYHNDVLVKDGNGKDVPHSDFPETEKL